LSGNRFKLARIKDVRGGGKRGRGLGRKGKDEMAQVPGVFVDECYSTPEGGIERAR